MEEKEFGNIYAIPANYTDSGKLMGGMLETRNTIETAFLLFLIGYPLLMWVSMPGMAKVIVMTVILLPVAVIGLMGIGGDSLMGFLYHMARFWLRRRKLHLRRIGYRYEQNKPAKDRSKSRPAQSR